MTEQPSEKVLTSEESDLQCSICKENFKNPKILPSCLHIFCKSCLDKLVAQQLGSGYHIICPICQEVNPLPDNGVDELETDLYTENLTDCQNCRRSEIRKAIKYCHDCRRFMCKECLELHKQWAAFDDHEVVNARKINIPGIQSTVRLKCKVHPNKDVTSYCESCSELVCIDCKQEMHKYHLCKTLNEAALDHRKELDTNLEVVTEKLHDVDHALSAITATENELNNPKRIEDDIHNEIGKLHELLDQQAKKLQGDLSSLTTQKVKALDDQKDKITKIQEKIKRCKRFADDRIKSRRDEVILMIKSLVLKRIEHITAEFDPNMMQPLIEADTKFLHDTEQVYTAIENFGSVFSQQAAINNCVTSGEGRTYARNNAQATVRVTEVNHNLDLTAELIDINNGAPIECSITQSNDCHTISYQPVSRGKHSLHIKANSRQISGSPFLVHVIPSQEELDTPSVVPELKSCHGVAINSKGEIIVSQRSEHCITIINPRSENRISFGKTNNEMQLESPRGVAVDGEDNIYVVDNGNNRIVKYTPNGKYIAKAGSKGSGQLQFDWPVGICYNKTTNQLFVCDQNNHRIQVLTTSLEYVTNFGSQQSKGSQFECLEYLAFDDTNCLYITDFESNEVLVFTAEGKFLRAFSDKDNGEKLRGPFGIAIDSSNTVYVTERGPHCVSVFTTQGEYLTTFGRKGAEDGVFEEPKGICTDRNNTIYICDHDNERLQIF